MQRRSWPRFSLQWPHTRWRRTTPKRHPSIAPNRARRRACSCRTSIAPRTDSQRAFAFVLGGYDTPREKAQLEGTADVTLFGPVAARVGVLYGQSINRLRPSAGLRVQALSQGRITASTWASVRSIARKASPRPKARSKCWRSLARSFGHLVPVREPDLRPGPGSRRARRRSSARVPVCVSARFHGGLDTRLRFDLGSDAGKRRAEGEARVRLGRGADRELRARRRRGRRAEPA